MIKKFEQFSNNYLKLKDIISNPKDLNDIFELCKNEIELTKDSSIIIFYCKIYFDCLMQYHNLTNGYVDIIKEIRNSISKSNNEKEVKFQYRQITRPSSKLSADLLKMVNDYKKINFEKVEMQKYDIMSISMSLINELFTNEYNHSRSRSFRSKLLNSKITIS